MSYSGGMPALYPIGCLNFFILYWAYKILLLKHYKKTTSFDAQLPIASMGYFRIALILHIAFGSFQFSNSNILSAKNLIYLKWVRNKLVTYEHYLPAETDGFFDRFGSGVGLLYFLFVVLLSICTIIYKFAFTVVHKVFDAFIYIICCGGAGKKETDEERDLERKRLDEMGLDSFSDNILEDYSFGGLASLMKRAKE